MSEQGGPPSRPAAGWMVDPHDPGMLRYWDGSAWTEHRTPGPRQSPTMAAASAEPTESIWTREWSRKTWSRVLVYGVLASAVIGLVAHEQLKEDEFHQSYCQALVQDGLNDPTC